MSSERFDFLKDTRALRGFLSGIAFFILTLLFILEYIPFKGLTVILTAFWIEMFIVSILLIFVFSIFDYLDDGITLRLKMDIDEWPSIVKGLLLNIAFISLFGFLMAFCMIGLEFYGVV